MFTSAIFIRYEKDKNFDIDSYTNICISCNTSNADAVPNHKRKNYGGMMFFPSGVKVQMLFLLLQMQ